MSATWELFERWKASKGFDSNNAAALSLGTTRQTVHNWKEGRNGEAHVIERMCSDLGEDPVPVILQAFAEASRDAQAKRALQRLAKRFRGAGLVAALGALPYLSASPVSAHSAETGHCEGSGVFIMRTRRRSTRRPARELQALRPSRRSKTTWKPYPPAFRCSA